MLTAKTAPTTDFWRVVIVIAFARAKVVEVFVAAAASRAEDDTVAARPTGAASTPWVASRAASPLAPTVTPRSAKNALNRSTARLTRFCAACSLMPRMAPISRADLRLKITEQQRVSLLTPQPVD